MKNGGGRAPPDKPDGPAAGHVGSPSCSTGQRGVSLTRVRLAPHKLPSRESWPCCGARWLVGQAGGARGEMPDCLKPGWCQGAIECGCGTPGAQVPAKSGGACQERQSCSESPGPAAGAKIRALVQGQTLNPQPCQPDCDCPQSGQGLSSNSGLDRWPPLGSPESSRSNF